MTRSFVEESGTRGSLKLPDETETCRRSEDIFIQWRKLWGKIQLGSTVQKSLSFVERVAGFEKGLNFQEILLYISTFTRLLSKVHETHLHWKN